MTLGVPRSAVPSLDKIAQYWWNQDHDPTYQDRLSHIGLGEPFCFVAAG